ncbi:hypothetical protein ACTMU2_40440 [Cupriavidus basilensis]
MTSFTYDAAQAGTCAGTGPFRRRCGSSGSCREEGCLGAAGDMGRARRCGSAMPAIFCKQRTPRRICWHFRAEYLLHASIQDIIAFDERDRAASLLQACFRDGLPKQAEIRFANAITGTRWIDLRICRHVGADGKASLLLFGTDVTRWAQKLSRS